MPRTYTLTVSRSGKLPPEEHTYTGFNRRMSPPPAFLAVVVFNGEYDTYSLDSTDGIVELQRYLDHRDGETGTICAVYSLLK